MSTSQAAIVGYYVVDGMPIVVTERWGAVTAHGRPLHDSDWVERAEPISPERYLQLVSEGRPGTRAVRRSLSSRPPASRRN